MIPPNLKIRFQDKILNFQLLGQFKIERDKKGAPIIFKSKGQTEKSYLLSIQTELTKSGNTEMLTIIPNQLRLKLQRKYYDTKNLKDIWRLPGIYAFVSKRNNKIKYRYIGRASRAIAQRLRGYLSPGPTQTTNAYVNRLIFNSLNNGESVLIYFYPEQDIEKELQILLRPDWNRETPRNTQKPKNSSKAS